MRARRCQRQNPPYESLRGNNARPNEMTGRRDRQNSALSAQNRGLSRRNQDLQGQLEDVIKEKAQLECEVRKMGARCDSAIADAHKADSRYHNLVEVKNKLESRVQKFEEEQGELRLENDKLNRAHDEDQTTIRGLERQVVRCKAAISSSTRPEDLPTDDTIESKAGHIFFELQNFVVQKFRKVPLGNSAVLFFRPIGC